MTCTLMVIGGSVGSLTRTLLVFFHFALFFYLWHALFVDFKNGFHLAALQLLVKHKDSR